MKDNIITYLQGQFAVTPKDYQIDTIIEIVKSGLGYKYKKKQKNVCVPYQLCPKCNGDGTVIVPYWNQSTTPISTCNLCWGAKVIPMHRIP